MEKKLPSFDVPEAAHDLISEFMRIRGVKSRSEALRMLLAESPSLRAIAGTEDLREEFAVGRIWGGYHPPESKGES